MFNAKLFNEASKKVPYKYLLANLVSIRTKQIMNGANPLVEVEDAHPIDIALQEIAEGLIEPRQADILATEDDIFSAS